MDPQGTNDLIEVVFRAEVFKFGTVFSGWVFDSTRPHEVRQAVTAGDADPLVDSNTLSVELAVIRPQTINALRLVSSVFTPNGDGTNDELQIEFDLLNLVGAVSVTVDLYDLSGQKLGKVFDGVAASGRFSAACDGRDGEGHLAGTGALHNPSGRRHRPGTGHRRASSISRVLSRTTPHRGSHPRST